MSRMYVTQSVEGTATYSLLQNESTSNWSRHWGYERHLLFPEQAPCACTQQALSSEGSPPNTDVIPLRVDSQVEGKEQLEATLKGLVVPNHDNWAVLRAVSKLALLVFKFVINNVVSTLFC